MSEFIVPLEVLVRVRVADESDAITRVTGPGGDEWRGNLYPLHTRDDVLKHLAAQALNGVDDASRLEGWADLKLGDCIITIDECGPSLFDDVEEAA